MTQNASVFFHWNIIYCILKGTLDLDFVLGLFIYWRLVFSLIRFFFQSTSQFCFGIVIPYYCSLSTTLHTCYRCDILSTCITHVTARKQVFKTFWLPVEIIVDIILFWIYFANKMCFKFTIVCVFVTMKPNVYTLFLHWESKNSYRS